MTAIDDAIRHCKTCNPGAVHTWVPGTRPGTGYLRLWQSGDPQPVLLNRTGVG
jgi:hypothetical protein